MVARQGTQRDCCVPRKSGQWGSWPTPAAEPASGLLEARAPLWVVEEGGLLCLSRAVRVPGLLGPLLCASSWWLLVLFSAPLEVGSLSLTSPPVLIFPLGIRTEQDFYVRLIDSMTKQVSFLILHRRGDDTRVTRDEDRGEGGCCAAGGLELRLWKPEDFGPGSQGHTRAPPRGQDGSRVL